MLTESCEKVAKVAKVAKILYCSNCDYTTSRKSSYDKHILTSKHKIMVDIDPILTDVDTMLTDVDTAKKLNVCECGKIFKFRQSLHVHKKNAITMSHWCWKNTILINQTTQLIRN